MIDSLFSDLENLGNLEMSGNFVAREKVREKSGNLMCETDFQPIWTSQF